MAQRTVPNTLCISLFAGSVALLGTPVLAGAHTWDVNEVFSNADGTIQFIELREANGTPGETGVNGHSITSNTRTYLIPPPALTPPTTSKHLLFATPAFAALPGAPTPNYIFPAGSVPFFSTGGDTIQYTPYDTFVFGAGLVPTDGVNSLNRNLTTGPNSPTNYAGQTGSVNAAPGPPAVPDGTGGSTPIRGDDFDPGDESLSVSWDLNTCSGQTNHQIIYGGRSQLPAAPGGLFGLTGAACSIGNVSPYTWNPSPPVAAGELLWWMILVTNGSNTEGSWGQGSDGLQRNGPGAGGVSAQCGMTTKDASNTCGQ